MFHAELKNKEKEVFIIRAITNKEMKKLYKNGIIRQTDLGIVSKDGRPTGFYGTKTKRYIEDKYVEIAQQLP